MIKKISTSCFLIVFFFNICLTAETSYCINSSSVMEDGYEYSTYLSGDQLKSIPKWTPFNKNINEKLKTIISNADVKLSSIANKNDYTITEIAFKLTEEDRWYISITYTYKDHFHRGIPTGDYYRFHYYSNGDIGKLAKEKALSSAIEESKRRLNFWGSNKKRTFDRKLHVSSVNAVKYYFSVLTKEVNKTQSWSPKKDNVPISFKKQLEIARDSLSTYNKDQSIEFSLSSLTLQRYLSSDNWYCLICFFDSKDKLNYVKIPVLFSGEIVKGTLESPYKKQEGQQGVRKGKELGGKTTTINSHDSPDESGEVEKK